MTPDPSPEAWAQARYDYEHTDKPVDDICFDLGVSPNTLRDRVRRWRWTPRRQPIPAEGPPPLPRIEPAVPLVPLLPAPEPAALCGPEAAPPDSPPGAPAPPVASRDAKPPDPAEIAARLQAAVRSVLPAIEAIVAKLAAGSMQPREMERAGRTLSSLTRTLRELNDLLSRQPPAGRICTCDMPENIDEFRIELARRIDALVASETGAASGGDQTEEERG